MEEVCSGLMCSSEKYRTSKMRTGPALEGTPCGKGRWCNDGKCTSTPAFDTSIFVDPSSGNEVEVHFSLMTHCVDAVMYATRPLCPRQVTDDSAAWTAWETTPCRSGCIESSRGYKTKSRRCVRHVSGREVPADGCKGKAVEFDFCDDAPVCRGKKTDLTTFANTQCDKFTEFTKEIKKGGTAARAKHNKKKLWPACAIFCESASGEGFYTPVIDLASMPNIDPFYPDGTLCHKEEGTNYYCQKNLCLSENARVARSGSEEFDFPRMAGEDVPQSVFDYFKLDENLEALPGSSPGVGPQGDSQGEVELDDELHISEP